MDRDLYHRFIAYVQHVVHNFTDVNKDSSSSCVVL